MCPISLKYHLPKAVVREPVTIGDHVRRRRTELGLTQADVAEVIGVCWNAVMRWEQGSRIPGVTSLPAIVAFLGYDPRPEPEAFAAWLQWLRGSLGLDQHQMAAKLDVPHPTFRAWEKELYSPNAVRLAEVKKRGLALLQ